MRIGIMAAMPEEIQRLMTEMASDRIEKQGMREYHQGRLWGTDAVLVFSRWGKVAAASTATHLITQHKVDKILFTGVAGAVDPSLHLGDIVVGAELVQHDMDASPLFPRHEIPLIGVSRFQADSTMTENLKLAARKFTDNELSNAVSPELIKEFNLRAKPVVQSGLIASGDKFFASQGDLAQLRSQLPCALCVEMEGAAVAQVCHEYDIPFAIVRTVSDSADEHAPANFPKFIQSVASVYSFGILKEFFSS